MVHRPIVTALYLLHSPSLPIQLPHCPNQALPPAFPHARNQPYSVVPLLKAEDMVEGERNRRYHGSEIVDQRKIVVFRRRVATRKAEFCSSRCHLVRDNPAMRMHDVGMSEEGEEMEKLRPVSLREEGVFSAARFLLLRKGDGAEVRCSAYIVEHAAMRKC
jgi:hypothetical protein